MYCQISTVSGAVYIQRLTFTGMEWVSDMLSHILFILALLTHFGIIPISGKLWGCGGDVM